MMPLTRFGTMLTAAAVSIAAPAFAAPVKVNDCMLLQVHGQPTQACFTQLSQSSSAYERAEGLWGLEDYTGANEQFRIAEQQASGKGDAFIKVRWGMLLHERFNDAEAAALFHEALEKDPESAQAYVGLATVSADEFSSQAEQYLAKAEELNPKMAVPHEMAAAIALVNDNRERATVEADKALALDGDAAQEALAVHAALDLVADKPADAWFARITAVNPHPGEAYMQVAHQLELHYRFTDAAEYYHKATEAEPRLWAAHSAYGVELMRLGETEKPARELELAYNNGYKSPATVNSLRLLDSLKTFDVTKSDKTVFKLDKKENEVFLPYLQAELNNIIATYSKKYGMTLPGPVQVEVYPNHEDFAVRTMGMPGLGALGVTFGEVVAMDSPTARPPGDFNWGATLWHEMSHVFIITATNQRVPRWFTEGLAVHEEGAHSPEWADRVTPDVLVAIRDRKLLPVTRLDRGYVTQEYPQQVLVSYFQGGAICDYIAGKWGESKLLDMVHSYAAKQTTAEAIQQDLGMSAEEFDKQFLAWIDTKYGAEAKNFDAWHTKLKDLATATQAKKWDDVIAQAPAIIAMYPEYVGEANAYEALAAAYKAKNQPAPEADALAKYMHAGGQQPVLLKQLATLQEAAGDRAAAAATLTRVLYIYPLKDAELHQRLGALLLDQKQYEAAIREYAVVVASGPLDMAGAEYNLATAYMAAGQRDKAEESVVTALEAAPDYKPAQKLLLQLQAH